MLSQNTMNNNSMGFNRGETNANLEDPKLEKESLSINIGNGSISLRKSYDINKSRIV